MLSSTSVPKKLLFSRSSPGAPTYLVHGLPLQHAKRATIRPRTSPDLLMAVSLHTRPSSGFIDPPSLPPSRNPHK